MGVHSCLPQSGRRPSLSGFCGPRHPVCGSPTAGSMYTPGVRRLTDRPTQLEHMYWKTHNTLAVKHIHCAWSVAAARSAVSDVVVVSKFRRAPRGVGCC